MSEFKGEKTNQREHVLNRIITKQVNGSPQSFSFTARGVTYWFDKQRKKAFCLVEIPDVENIKLLHEKVFGSVPLKIVETDSDIAEQLIEQLRKTDYLDDGVFEENEYYFILSRKLSPEKIRVEDRKLVKELIQDFHVKTTKTVLQYEGKIIRFFEDYLMVSFAQPKDAIDCALQLKHEFNTCRKKIPYCKVSMKMGICTSTNSSWQIDALDNALKQARRMSYIADNRILVTMLLKTQFDYESSEKFSEDEIRVLSNQDQEFISSLMDYMEIKWKDENLHVNDLAETLNCSKSKIYRKMMELTGKSPNSFIKDYRLDRSIDLIRIRHGNISEVAFESGFASPSYFTKCFQKRFGLNPTEYIQTIEL